MFAVVCASHHMSLILFEIVLVCAVAIDRGTQSQQVSLGMALKLRPEFTSMNLSMSAEFQKANQKPTLLPTQVPNSKTWVTSINRGSLIG